MLNFLQDQTILSKDFGESIRKGDKIVASPASWTSKQQDFFNGERRFIFASQNCQKWIDTINATLQKKQNKMPTLIGPRTPSQLESCSFYSEISIGDVNDSKDDGNVDTCDEDSEV